MATASAEIIGDELMSGTTTTTTEYTSVINAAVEAVITLANATTPFATITRGALPTGHGLVCEVGPSRVQDVYLDKNTYIPLDITFNGKHHNLKTLSDAMNKIHSTLTRAKTYTSGDGWQIVDITNYTLPQIIGRENNNDWLMASSLLVKIYQKGD